MACVDDALVDGRVSRCWPRPAEPSARLVLVLVAYGVTEIVIRRPGRPDQSERRRGVVLTGAGPAVIGAIAGSAIPLGLAFGHLWLILVCRVSYVDFSCCLLVGPGHQVVALDRGHAPFQLDSVVPFR